MISLNLPGGANPGNAHDRDAFPLSVTEVTARSSWSAATSAAVISHDRWFLNRLATHILAFEGDSHVEWFEGDFDSYETDKMRPPELSADR